jgi:glyoxylase-like metal-dependent hydrolase (beta-lactamase superfamily II)
MSVGVPQSKIKFYNVKMIIKSYPVYKSYLSWSSIFLKPSPVNLKSFKTGTVTINRKGTLNPQHPLASNIKDEKLEVPIIAHLVHHEEKGYFLLDTGLDASYYLDPHGGLEGSEVDEFNQNSNTNIAYYLSKEEIILNGVFLSHLHPDHAVGQRELPRNIIYVAAKGEYDNYHPDIQGDFLRGLEILYEINFTETSEIPPLGPSADLLGDGSLWGILTQGHTSAHMSFLLNSIDGPIFLTMDAAFIRENLELGVSSSDYTWDIEMAQETLEKIIDFLRNYPQCKVRVGHEM